ncbi:serine/threonine-protein kinase [Amycolatopsis sp. RTGN1]|uniref:serine/threonine-protein kinase n=1 Tax=Amycolatopsis ponsaeliensis TaxID=2992142 RepID=UPI00254B9D80|nr:serine/threonine-protein kinase [Amycolatopsis sp. RTGN1]
MSDADDVTCARFDLGEFAVHPRSLDERPPELLAGRYEVGRLIGTGGSARVYRAYDLRLEREVAVKVYDRDVVAMDQRRRLREMSIQAGITHPGVVALLDSGTDHGRTYLVMQLVEGENLAERLLGGPMPAERVTALADGLAEALAHVHARRIVHRDLKPANVFLSAHGPLIGDFGIAHALDTTHITGTGVVPGTAAYLAPEQVSGEPAGPPVDVYALGLILLECVTGHREYAGTMVEAAMARLTRPPRVPEGLPPSLAHTLRRMTRREPADRPTADEVRRLLHAPAPTLPWATGRFAAAGVLRRWHRATPAGRGRLGAVGRRRAAGDDGGQVGAAAIAGDSGQIDAGAGDPGRRGRAAGAAGDHRLSDSTAGHLDPRAHTAGNRSTVDAAASNPGPRELASQHHPSDSTAGHLDPRAHTPADRSPFDAAPSNPGAGPFDPTLADTGIPHRAAPTGPRKILTAVGLSPASLPAQRRRFTAAAGLTAAAVAAVSAMLLSSQTPETSTPAQPPAPSSPAPTQETLAGSGTPDPAGPAGTESADLEPAAVTRQTQASPKTTKPGKPPKTETHGKGKGKGPGHD